MMSPQEQFFLVALVIVGVSLFAHWAWARSRANRLRAELQKVQGSYAKDSERWNQFSQAAQAEIARLGKWKHVADADAKAAEIMVEAQRAREAAATQAAELVAKAQSEANVMLSEARNRLEKSKAKARTEVEAAEAEAKELLKEARAKAKRLKADAEERYESATMTASQILSKAEERAKEIGGSAYNAMKNAQVWQEAATAMRNKIIGYGREYLLPQGNLLDELAEQFAHKDAGKELKFARDRSNNMIKNGTAAVCDYEDPQRRESATRFVVDAFNGKVDSIIARVKNDNFGKLEQEVKDAFSQVNFHGLAFESARITDEYLEARLTELRFAAKVQIIKQQEREEQRAIREQMREEERARREYERAQKEAQRDEDMIRKAVEKAREQAATASEEQKAQYEAQMQELMQKLQEAEEKKQRTLSMAQQTTQGHVYIISNVGSFGECIYKIGLTRRLEPLDRVRELGDASVPFEFDVHAMIWSEDAPALERELHKHFVMMQVNKVNHRKEFFRVELSEIREQIEKLGYETHWTMTAEAAQYRESLAIDEAIKKDPSLKESWLTRQLQLDPVGHEEDEEEELETRPAPRAKAPERMPATESLEG